MLSIDECRRPACLLRLSNRMKRKRGFTRAFRPKNLNHAALRQATNTKRNIKAERSSGNRFNLNCFAAPQLHRRAFTKGTINLGECRF